MVNSSVNCQGLSGYDFQNQISFNAEVVWMYERTGILMDEQAPINISLHLFKCVHQS